jgi:ferredoxin
VKVCPSAGLQPIALEAGWEGVWTPALIPRLGWCSYDCCLCGQVCPTGAIPRLTLEEKRQAVMGIARIEQDRCIPWAHLRICTVCHDTCPLPVPDKAIVLEKTETVDELGQKLIIRRPRVVQELCIGCGVCEYNCPVAGQAAVRIYAPDARASS